MPPRTKTAVSIVICSYGRSESLDETLASLSKQTFKDFEVILITELGNLSELRQRGLVSAVGDIVTFIDDDVYCPPTWLQGVVEGFRKGIVGVTGPSVITNEYSKNRDYFKFKTIRRIQEWLFEVPSVPGKLSIHGNPSMVGSDEECSYEGQVDYLECCNFSVKKKEALSVGGFDPSFIRTSEWSEVDLALKLTSQGTLLFCQKAGLIHKPSKQGVYRERLSTEHRWKNFMLFQKRWEGQWIAPGLRTSIYRGFVWTYLKMKEKRMI